jgi:hypothetical protein
MCSFPDIQYMFYAFSACIAKRQVLTLEKMYRSSENKCTYASHRTLVKFCCVPVQKVTNRPEMDNQ